MKPIDFVIPNISTPKGQIILYDLPLIPFILLITWTSLLKVCQISNTFSWPQDN